MDADINACESNVGQGEMERKYPALSRATHRQRPRSMYLGRLGAVLVGGWSMRSKTNETWRIRAESAWRTAARCAALAQEADQEEREHYIRMRDAWIGLANRCQFLDLPKRPRANSKTRWHGVRSDQGGRNVEEGLPKSTLMPCGPMSGFGSRVKAQLDGGPGESRDYKRRGTIGVK